MHTIQQPKFVDARTALAISFMVLTFAAGAVLGATLDINVPVVADQTVTVPAGDGSYDAVEATRAGRSLSLPAGDGSYDAVEETRAGRSLD